jgi:hypothetical protein
MALSAGEVEALLKMRDELSSTVDKALAKIKDFGSQAPSHIEKPNASWLKMGESVLEGAKSFAIAQLGIQSVEKVLETLIGFVEDCTKAFIDGSSATSEMDQAMRTAGEFTPQLSKQYQELAESIQNTTTISDTAAKSAIASFTSIGNVGPANMERALYAAADLAQGLHLDFPAAVEVASKAMQGHVEMLQRYGFAIDKSADQGRQFENVMSGIAGKFSGREAANVASYAGQVKQAANSWESLKEALGKVVVENPLVQTGMLVLTAEIKKQTAEVIGLAHFAEVYVTQSKLLGMGSLALASTMAILRAEQAKGKETAVGGAQATTQQVDALKLFNAEIDRQKTAVTSLDPAYKKAIDRGDDLNFSVTKMATALKLDEEVVATEVAAHKAAAAEIKKHTDAAKELASMHERISTTAHATILSLNEMGLSESDIAQITGKTVTVVRALIDAEKTRLDFAKAFAVFEGKVATDGLAAAQKLRDVEDAVAKHQADNQKTIRASTIELQHAQMEGAMTSFDYQAKLIEDERDAKKLAFAGTTEDMRLYRGLQDQIAAASIAKLTTAETLFGAQKKVLMDQEVAVVQAAYDKMRESGEYSAQQVYEAWAKVTGMKAKAGDSTAQLKLDLLDTLNAIPSIIQQAIAGGGGMKAAVANIGGSLGADLGKKAGTEIGKKIGGGIGTFMGGPIGAAIGSLIGVGIGKLVEAFSKPVWKQMQQSIGKEWGVTISDALAKQLEADAKRLGGTEAAKLFNLKGLIDAGGGITTKNLTFYTGKLHDLFSEIQMGHLKSADTAKVLDDNWQAFVKTGTDAIGLLSPALVQIIKLNDEFKTGSKEIATYVAGQVGAAATGIAAALKVTSDAYAATAVDEKTVADLRGKLADEQQNQADAIASGNVEAADRSALAQADLVSQIADANKALDAQRRIIDATAIRSQSAATGMSGAIVGIINANMKAGQSFVTAVKGASPAILALKDQLDRTGFSGGAAFDVIQRMASLASDAVAGPALTSIEGITAGIIGLSNAGILTQDTFGGLAEQVRTTYDALIMQGADGASLLIAMQPDIQALWEQEKLFGLHVDDSTQALIDQAVQAGLVGEKHKSATQQMVDDLDRIANALDKMAGITTDAFKASAAAVASSVAASAAQIGGLAGAAAGGGSSFGNVSIAPGESMKGGVGGASPAQNSTTIVELDGYAMAQLITPYIPDEVKRLGLG